MGIHKRVIVSMLVAIMVCVAPWSVAGEASAITGSITLTVACQATPERTTIVNSTDQALDLANFLLVSIIEPSRGQESFVLSGLLPAGAAITYESGPAATTNILSREAIYASGDPDEGAYLFTQFGSIVVPCAKGSVTRSFGDDFPAPPPAPDGEERCFPQTGFCVRGPFLEHWLANGGLAQHGLPLTGEFDERNLADGREYRVQYFERARFEYHPEAAGTPFLVQLGLLGREQFLARYPGGRPTGDGGERCFPETGRCIGGAFLTYWQANGGLARQGLPLSDPFDEVSPTDGRTYRVQYFERARFELHPEGAGTENEVLLGLLGREQLLTRYPGGPPRPVR